MPGAGFEPARPFEQRLLRPQCLPNSTTRALANGRCNNFVPIPTRSSRAGSWMDVIARGVRACGGARRPGPQPVRDLAHDGVPRLTVTGWLRDPPPRHLAPPILWMRSGARPTAICSACTSAMVISPGSLARGASGSCWILATPGSCVSASRPCDRCFQGTRSVSSRIRPTTPSGSRRTRCGGPPAAPARPGA